MHLRNYTRYTRDEEIGRGGFGIVYEGVDLQTNKPVVIKEFKEMDMKKAIRECLLLQTACFGPNLVKFIDILKEKSEIKKKSHGYSKKEMVVSLVFEAVDFVSHRKLYKRLKEKDTKKYMKKLLLAVKYLHDHSILHRDLKSSNVLIDPKTETLRLIDLGISRFHSEGTF